MIRTQETCGPDMLKPGSHIGGTFGPIKLWLKPVKCSRLLPQACQMNISIFDLTASTTTSPPRLDAIRSTLQETVICIHASYEIMQLDTAVH